MVTVDAAALLEGIAKNKTDDQGHVHGTDGKFVTKASPSKVAGGDGERIHANGVTVGHIKESESGKTSGFTAYHPNAKDPYGTFKSREDALEALERAHIAMARRITGSPEKLHSIIRDTYLPGTSGAKNVQRRIPIHHIRSMMRDAHRLGAHYGDPVKASAMNLDKATEAALDALHQLATKHLGHHEWDDESLDKQHTVGATDALRAVADAFEEGKKMHESTAKMVDASTLLLDIKKRDEAASSLSYLVKAPGSFEDMLRRLRVPLIDATPCEHKPKLNEDGTEQPPEGSEKWPHSLDVLATFPDHAYVRCYAEDKIWKIPYTIDGDQIACEKAEPVTLQFTTEGDAEGKDSLPADQAEGASV